MDSKRHLKEIILKNLTRKEMLEALDSSLSDEYLAYIVADVVTKEMANEILKLHKATVS